MPSRKYDVWTLERGVPSQPPPTYSNRNDTIVSSLSPQRDLERARQREDEEEDRGQWGNKAEFILSCVGLSVGLGNVWRFPYLAYENGGAAFLIAYLVLQLLIGKPMYFMELVMGQFSGKGPTKVWDMNPSAKGIGVSMCIISLITSIYYNTIMAYSLYYFFSSMQRTLPWSECTDEWVEKYNCVNNRSLIPDLDKCKVHSVNACVCTGRESIDSSLENFNCTPRMRTAPDIFFYEEVIQKSDGVHPDEMGDPLWKLTLCLLLSWTIVVICLIKGIKSSGKVVYFTATFPYILLIVLLIRGSLLDGAIDGVEFFIIPKWYKLTDIKVWVAAAGQMFFSLSVSFGGIIMFGSYNKFKNMVYYDALFISVMDLVTSVIAGFVVFTTFGGMAHTIGTTVEKVAEKGYGLAFVAYPEALLNLTPSQFWSILFFFMLFTLGLDSEFGFLETILTCLQDEIPKLRKYKSPMCIILGICCFFMALPCVTPGGDYIVNIMDHYGADFSVLFLSCFEVISVMWVYGVRRFLRDVEYMLGSKPFLWPYWVFCWAFSAPCLIAALTIYRMVKYKSPSYDEYEDFPQFSQIIGWVLLSIALCPVPIWFLKRVLESLGRPEGERKAYIFNPTKDWVPNDGKRYLVEEEEEEEDGGYPMTKQGIDNPAATMTTFKITPGNNY